MSILDWRRARVVVLALVVGAAVTGAVAYASVPDGSGLIHTCYQVNRHGEVNGNSTLRVVDPASTVRAGQACDANEASLTFSQTGPTGPTGPTGATGPAGPTTAYSVHTTDNVTIGSNSLEPVETLTVPAAGSYFFLATVDMALTTTDPNEDVTSTCEVVFSAGALSATIDNFVRSNRDEPGNATMQAFETFPQAGTAELECNGLTAFAFDARITAIPVSSFVDTAAS